MPAPQIYDCRDVDVLSSSPVPHVRDDQEHMLSGSPSHKVSPRKDARKSERMLQKMSTLQVPPPVPHVSFV